MELIIHRVNSFSKLVSIPKKYGIEIDVRDYKKQLILSHDPFKKGENLERFLKKYEHGTLIVNIKSEFIEFKILKLLKKYKIKKFFFLDSSYPVIISLIKKKIYNFAIRVSDYESFENVIKIKPYCKWIWLEIFKNIKITKSQKNFIKKNKIKICLVSPELHNKPQNLNKTKNYIKKYRLKISAICTKYKYKNKWES